MSGHAPNLFARAEDPASPLPPGERVGEEAPPSRAPPPRAVIEEIRPLAGEPPRVSVRAGGRRVATLLHRTALDLNLRPGMELNRALLDRLRRAQAGDRAMRDLTRMVAGRALSRRAARERLLRKGHSPEAAEEACARAQRVDLLDDRKLARELIDSARSRAPVGRARLEERLRRAGIDDHTLARALDEHESERDELDDAKALAARRWAVLRARPGAERDLPRSAARLLRLLASRGYDEETARTAVEAAIGRSLDDVDDPEGA